jgi:citrate lyase subunit beta/citryl-CoA lyase
LESCETDNDLAAILTAGPTGIVLPKCQSAGHVRDLDARLAAFGQSAAQIGLMPIATETPASLFHLGSYADLDRPLTGLTWGAEDLSAAVGAVTARTEDGGYTPLYTLARSLCLAGATAANTAPIETVYPDFRDKEGLAAYAARGRRDGFRGMLAIHPDQVAVINAAFTPSPAEVAYAQRAWG